MPQRLEWEYYVEQRRAAYTKTINAAVNFHVLSQTCTWKSRSLPRTSSPTSRIISSIPECTPCRTRYCWALRLRAQGHEGEAFASLWDEAMSGMTSQRGQVVHRTLPGRDRDRMKLMDLPMNLPYTAASAYSSGSNDGILAGSMRRPRDLHDYFQRLESTGCNDDRAQPVYVATDDPGWIQDEIDRFLGASGCRNAKFTPCGSVKDPIDDADVGRTERFR
jgi:hypothetical protein